MKLFYCFLVLFLLNIQLCEAQIPFKIKAGGARSDVQLMDADAGPVITWYSGVTTNFRIGKRFFFQPELLYSKRGIDLRSQNTTTKIRFGYISMPLLLGWHPAKKITLLLGVEPGYMVSEYASEKYNRLSNVGDLVADRHFNVDIDLGLGYQPLPRWTVEIRAVVGVIGLYAEQYSRSGAGSPPPTGDYDGYHSLVQLGLSYDLRKN